MSERAHNLVWHVIKINNPIDVKIYLADIEVNAENKLIINKRNNEINREKKYINTDKTTNIYYDFYYKILKLLV